MSYHDSDSCLWNILDFSCLFFAASLIHNQDPCIFKWFLICEEFVLSLPVFFYVDIASLFKNQQKWHKSLWKHWKEPDKEASLTRGGVVLGTVSPWLLIFGPLSSMSLWILLFCFFHIFINIWLNLHAYLKQNFQWQNPRILFIYWTTALMTGYSCTARLWYKFHSCLFFTTQNKKKKN